MSEGHGFFTKIRHTIHALVLGALLAAAGTWLTLHLYGTLQKPLPEQRLAPRGEKVKLEQFLASVEAPDDTARSVWELTWPRVPGHFHRIDRGYEFDSDNFCVECHGPIPHEENMELRAFLNMHSFFITCETCHVLGPDGKHTERFGWITIADNKPVPAPDRSGRWGEYGALITPLWPIADGLVPLAMTEEKKAAAELEAMANPSEEEKKILNDRIHESCAEVAVECRECHRKVKPFLDFPKLGFTEERTSFLISAEVVDLVRRYEMFHMPKILSGESSGTENSR